MKLMNGFELEKVGDARLTALTLIAGVFLQKLLSSTALHNPISGPPSDAG